MSSVYAYFVLVLEFDFQMIPFAITITLNISIFIIFRLLQKYQINTLQTITTAFIVGAGINFYFIRDFNQFLFLNYHQLWLQLAVIVGVFSLFTTYLIAYSCRVCEITSSLTSNKVAFIIPLALSTYQSFSAYKFFSNAIFAVIGLGFLGLLFTVFRFSKKNKSKEPLWITFTLPMLVFIFSGLILIVINYSKLYIASKEQNNLFTTVIYSIAAVLGIVIVTGRATILKEPIEVKAIVAGVVVGTACYFYFYFQNAAVKLLGLSLFNSVSAAGIIILGAIISVLLFKEKFTILNKIGLGFVLLSLLLVVQKQLLDLVYGFFK